MNRNEDIGHSPEVTKVPHSIHHISEDVVHGFIPLFLSEAPSSDCLAQLEVTRPLGLTRAQCVLFAPVHIYAQLGFARHNVFCLISWAFFLSIYSCIFFLSYFHYWRHFSFIELMSLQGLCSKKIICIFLVFQTLAQLSSDRQTLRGSAVFYL